MPDHDNTSILSRHAKKRRVDIGMRRTFDTMSVNFDPSKVVVFNDMNPHGPEHDVECSMAQHADSEKSNVLRKLLKQANSLADTVIPFPGATIISHLIKNSLTKNGASEPKFQNNHFSSTDSEIHQEDACSTSSQGSPQGYMSPFSRPSVAQIDIDRLTEEHLKAKRARVESIIRGMSHSPSVALRSGENECALQPPSPRESYRENKRKQKLPQQQQQEQQQSFQHHVSACKVQKHEEHQQLKLQLEDMQKQLRQLQEKFYQIYDSTDSENDDVWNLTEESLHSDGMDNDNSDHYHSDNEISDLNPGHFLDQTQALFCKQTVVTEKDKRKQDGSQEKGQGPTSMYAEGKRLAEMLKQELNTAMSQVVDTVVKVFVKPPCTLTHEFSSVQMPREHFVVSRENTHFPTANQRLQCFGIIPNPLNSFGSMQVSSPNDQTEALPLVVRKSSPDQTGSLSTPGGHHHPGLHPSPLSTNMALSSSSFHHPFPLHLMGYPLQSPLVGPHESFPGKEKSPESVDPSKETNSLRIKMSSNHLRPVSPPHPGNHEGLSLSLIKSECRDFQDISDISPYSGSTISFQ